MMIDFTKIKTYPIQKRKNKVSTKDFLALDAGYDKHGGEDIKMLASAVRSAKQQHKQVIVMFGGHVIKVGMSLFLIDLMKRGFITHLATNGAGSIHDFEIALIGETSENVSSSIEDGSFGMAEETGRMMNEAIAESKDGYGKAVGELTSGLPYRRYSIFSHASELNIPITVHVAIGTDIIHQHPACDGAALGRTTYQDFQRFAQSVSGLEGGVIINIGSAVIMPEVFLKALSIARNLGHRVEHFTSANLDMNRHYRPTVNVVERPTTKGKGFNIIGLHQNTIPTLYNLIVGGAE
jgi:hypothetical protein